MSVFHYSMIQILKNLLTESDLNKFVNKRVHNMCVHLTIPVSILLLTLYLKVKQKYASFWI